MNWNECKPQIRQVWNLSLPAILTQITTIAMQYIDSAMVGALGANASASIGLVASTTWLFNGVTYAAAAGFSVQVAHRIGAGEESAARNVVRHGLAAALLLAGFLCILGSGISPHLPVWLGGSPDIQHDASVYFMIFAWMLPFSQLNSLMSSFLQCSGDMITPSILNAAMCLLDVLFNACLIPRYGVAGAGLGTALACAVISLLMTFQCCVRSRTLSLVHAEKGSFDSTILKRAFQIGTPVAMQEIAMNGAMVMSTRIIAPLGAVSIAANSFAVTCESLCYMPGYGIGSAATTLGGRCIGAKQHAEAKRYGTICIGMGALFMTGTGLLMMLICPWILKLLTPDPVVQELAVHVLRMELFAEPLFAVSIVAAGALRGAGDTLIPSLLNLCSIWGVRLGLALLLVPSMELTGLWTAMTIELCVRGLLLFYRHKTSPYYG